MGFQQWLLLLAIGIGITSCVAPRESTDPEIGAPESAFDFVERFEPGVISSGDEEYRIAFAPDDLTAYFGRAPEFFPRSRQATILVTHYGEHGWSESVPAPFSGRYSDIDPFITADGSQLFFSSIRPVGGEDRTDVELWLVERGADGAWGESVHLSSVGSEFDELYPSVDADGTLYFGSDRPHAPDAPRTWNVWRARPVLGGYAAPEILGPEVNSDETWEFNPVVSPDGRRLIFTRLDIRDPRGTRFGEIMVADWRNGGWDPARPVGPPVNSEHDEFHPSFSGDGRWFYFVRRNPLDAASSGDIFRVPVSAVPGLREAPESP